MRTTEIGWDRLCRNGHMPWQMPQRLAPANALHLVGPHELETLRTTLAAGRVPLDLQTKLEGLAVGSLLHRFIEQHSLRFIALLLAAQAGDFHRGTPADLERLLRVLAYVRKDDDAIPDHRPGGFADDHHEVRAVARDLESLLDEFKFWRLRHQVPRLWLANLASRAGTFCRTG
jgi:hypothetical protein